PSPPPSLHDALPISLLRARARPRGRRRRPRRPRLFKIPPIGPWPRADRQPRRRRPRRAALRPDRLIRPHPPTDPCPRPRQRIRPLCMLARRRLRTLGAALVLLGLAPALERPAHGEPAAASPEPAAKSPAPARLEAAEASPRADPGAVLDVVLLCGLRVLAAQDISL